MADTATTNLRTRPGNWIVGTVDGLQVHAKAFTDPSDYGMPDEPRISKLWVKTSGLGVVIYEYDRNEVSVDLMSADALAMVIAAVVEAL